MNAPSGKVYLVGAGPGDPGLITVRGRELLERADVVVYDSLVDERLLRYAPRAELIHVGKRTGAHTLTQDDIHQILVDQSRAHASVVRLKGGDPFIFGRGGEEALHLAEAGVPFEIVPGVTSSLAAAAYSGIPLTHRGKAASVSLITGHLDPEADPVALDRLHLEGTLTFYMAVKNIDTISKELVRLGRPADTPAAVIRWASLNRQKTVTGSLLTIAELCRNEGIESPVVLIVGQVVDMRESVKWFEGRPLYGKRIAVTRARARAAELVHGLQSVGADVFEFPTVRIEAMSTPDEAFDVGNYDWVLLTSINGVDMLFSRLENSGLDARDLKGLGICAVGARTAEAVREHFLRVDVQPDKHEPECVVPLLEEAAGGLADKKILVPRADIARSALPQALRERGATVIEWRSYRAEAPDESAALADALVEYAPHYVTFNSASAARNFAEILGPDRLARLKETGRFACIGPHARRAAEDAGMEISIEPVRHRLGDLIEAIVEWDRCEG